MTFETTVSRPGTERRASVATVSSGCWKSEAARPGKVMSLRRFLSGASAMRRASHIDQLDGVWEFFGVKRRAIGIVLAVLALGGGAAAVAILMHATRPAPIVVVQAQKRAIEARLSAPAADGWRPYAGRGREEVRVDVIAELHKRGDWRGLAAAELVAGDTQKAGEALAKAGESADAESDRAALALVSRDPKAALTHATRALQLAPGHAQAAWNRALALRDLALPRTAASAFEMIAARGAAGWGAEAKERARALREEVRTRETMRQAADAAGREMAKSGLVPAPEVVRAYPALIRHYLAQALITLKPAQLQPLVPLTEQLDTSKDAWLKKHVREAAAGKAPPKRMQAPDDRIDDELTFGAAQKALKAGDLATAERQAIVGLASSEGAGADPRDLPRRYLLLLAEIARARGETAVANAYVDEARLLT